MMGTARAGMDHTSDKDASQSVVEERRHQTGRDNLMRAVRQRNRPSVSGKTEDNPFCVVVELGSETNGDKRDI
jgi:hypothetical protein